MFEFLRGNWPLIAVPVLGLTAVHTLLPGPRRRPVLLGAASGLAALVVSGFLVVRVGGLNVETFLFYLFSAVAVLSGGLLVTQKNPARAALSFALVVLATCGLFLLQSGPFLMAATIIVYAGAIIVTFLFVIMLAQQQGPSDADARSREPFLASLTGFLLLSALLVILNTAYKPDLDRWVNRSKEHLDNIKALSEQESISDDRKRVLVRDLRKFCEDYDRWLRNEWATAGKTDPKHEPKRPPPQGKDLHDAVYNATQHLPATEDGLKKLSLGAIQDDVQKMYEEGLKARNNPSFGGMHPAPTAKDSPRLSSYSGAPADIDVGEMRRDDQGRPHLPAENTTYLGRSLFTDYLLSVELAGMLLLVATVGAIAISVRKSEGKPVAAVGDATRRKP